VLKLSFVVRQHTVAQQVFQERLIHITLRPNATSVLAYAMSQKPTFFPYGLEIMMFGLCNNWWRWNRSITPSAGAVGVGFDATYDFW
jgi:hypothetical protein